MLVLTRKIGQQIVLPGCGITIDVVGMTKRQVRLGIEAPPDVPVYRREILDRIHCPRESQPAGKAEIDDIVDRTFVRRTGGGLSFSSHVGNGQTG